MLKCQQALAKIVVKNANLSTEIQDPAAIPYFLWDEPMNVAQLKERLRGASYSERVRLLGKILREARDTDVWAFTTPDEVRQLWPELSIYLGRRRAFGLISDRQVNEEEPSGTVLPPATVAMSQVLFRNPNVSYFLSAERKDSLATTSVKRQ